MAAFLKKTKLLKWLICSGFVLTIAAVVLLLPSHSANAAWYNPIDWVTGSFSMFINAALLGIPYIFGLVGGSILTLASLLTSYFFTLNTEILPDKFHMIENGFRICLGIANLIFVIALIIIAFATILNVQEYSAKKLLGKLIVTAVLVNFSYLIVGVFLDMSHVLTMFFISGGGVANVGAKFGESIGAILQPQKFLVTPDIANLSTTVFSSEWLQMVLGAVMGSIFTWIAAIVMLSIAIMFLVRYIYLAVLIILMPLAWSLPLIPGMSEMSSKWWSKFTQQVLYLPAATFFIYLSMRLALSLQSSHDGFSTDLANTTTSYSNLPFAPQLIMQMIIPTGFLVASLIVASKLGGAGTGFGLKMANKVAGFAEKYARGVGSKVYSYQRNGKSIEAGVKKLAGAGSNALTWQGPQGDGKLKKGLRGLIQGGRAVATGGASKQIAGQLTEFSKDRESALEAAKASLHDLGEDQLNDMYHDAKHAPKDDTEFYAAVEHAVEEGDIDHLDAWMSDDATRARIVATAKMFDPKAAKDLTKSKTLKALAQYDPPHAALITGQTTEAVLGGMDAKALQSMKKDALSDEKVINGLTPSQLATAARGSGEREQLISDGLNAVAAKEMAALNDTSPEVVALKNEVAAKKLEMAAAVTAGNKELEKELQREINKIERSINNIPKIKSAGAELAALAGSLGSAKDKTGYYGSLEDAKEELKAALARGDTVVAKKFANSMDIIQKQISDARDKQSRIISDMDLNDPVMKTNTALRDSLKGIDSLANNIGSVVSQEKKPKKEHAHAKNYFGGGGGGH